MRWLLTLYVISTFAQTVPQGNLIRVKARPPAASARMFDRTIRLFPGSAGDQLGWMPVAADRAPGKYRLEILDAKGTVLNTSEVVVTDAGFLKQDVKLQPIVEDLRPSPGETDTVKAFQHIVSDTRFWREPLALPVPGCMTSPFGAQRFYNGKPSGRYHAGLDQRARTGQPVHAIAAGVVRMVREYNLHGNVVGIDHGQGLLSIYQHLSKFAVAEGAKVNQGDVIGFAGSTGRSSAPHLHWTVAANGLPTNPLQWVTWNPCPVKSKPAPRRRRRSRDRNVRMETR